MLTVANELMGKLNLLLRTVAPGLLAVGIVALLDREDRLCLRAFFREASTLWVGLGIATAAGFVAYALQVSVLEDLIMALAVVPFIRRRCADELPGAYRDLSRWQLLQNLTRERWARLGSGVSQISSIQNRLESRYAWLTFLYCVGHLLLTAGIVASVHVSGRFEWPVFAGSLAAFSCALVMDVSVTRHEFWLVKNHPQLLENAS